MVISGDGFSLDLRSRAAGQLKWRPPELASFCPVESHSTGCFRLGYSFRLGVQFPIGRCSPSCKIRPRWQRLEGLTWALCVNGRAVFHVQREPFTFPAWSKEAL